MTIEADFKINDIVYVIEENNFRENNIDPEYTLYLSKIVGIKYNKYGIWYELDGRSNVIGEYYLVKKGKSEDLGSRIASLLEKPKKLFEE